MEEASENRLPGVFLDFLKENGVDPSIYTISDSTPRYIRYGDLAIVSCMGHSKSVPFCCHVYEIG